MSKLTITVQQKSNKAQQWIEGSYQLPSSTTARLVRKDGSPQFTNTSSLKATARNLAKNLGRELEYVEPAKKAAKKSVKKAAPKSKASKK